MANTAILEHGAKIAAAAAILAIGLAEARSVAAGPEATPSPAAGGYLPSISDLMIATIQPRHERLWQTARSNPGTASHSPKPTPTLPTHVIPATRRSTMAWSKSAHLIRHLRQT